jgi:hypothetical protein
MKMSCNDKKFQKFRARNQLIDLANCLLYASQKFCRAAFFSMYFAASKSATFFKNKRTLALCISATGSDQ